MGVRGEGEGNLPLGAAMEKDGRGIRFAHGLLKTGTIDLHSQILVADAVQDGFHAVFNGFAFPRQEVGSEFFHKIEMTEYIAEVRFHQVFQGVHVGMVEGGGGQVGPGGPCTAAGDVVAENKVDGAAHQIQIKGFGDAPDFREGLGMKIDFKACENAYGSFPGHGQIPDGIHIKGNVLWAHAVASGKGRQGEVIQEGDLPEAPGHGGPNHGRRRAPGMAAQRGVDVVVKHGSVPGKL